MKTYSTLKSWCKKQPTKQVSPSKNTYPTDGPKVYSILGGIIGDIAGSTREGYRRNVLSPRKLLTSSSSFTDDTSLMMAVVEWLGDRESELADYLIKWRKRYPHAGYGSSFKAFAETRQAQASGGNGAAMRVAPCGVVATTLEEAVALAEQQCKVSHLADVSIVGAQSVAAAVFIAKEGRLGGLSAEEVKSKVKSYVEDNFGYNLGRSLEQIQAQSYDLAKQREEYRKTGVTPKGYINTSNAALSCPMAISAFLLGGNYEEVVRYAIAMGGDTDSIACMAGAIAAQFYGIPQSLADEAIVYLPRGIVKVLQTFEPHNNFVASKVAPPKVSRWRENCETIVYGSGNNDNESGYGETVLSRFTRRPQEGYAIPTIGKSLEEIQQGVATFIDYAKSHPKRRFHVRKVGYDKAGYTPEQIAPMFALTKELTNVLLPKEIVEALGW